MMSGSQSLHVPGSQLYDSSHGMRPLSQATVYSDGSSVLAEVQQTTGRPPVHPARSEICRILFLTLVPLEAYIYPVLSKFQRK